MLVLTARAIKMKVYIKAFRGTRKLLGHVFNTNTQKLKVDCREETEILFIYFVS